MVDKKITPLYLKTHTQKFDLLTIFLLDLSRKSIGALGSIPECTNLLMLDISYNGIQVITGIETLVNLKHINLAYNKLTQIDALKGCTALERVDLQGNQIKDMRTLEAVATGLENLKIIYLQEFNGSGPNPVCSAVKNVRQRLFELWPKLKAVDGFRQNCQVFEPGPIDDEVEKP